MSFLFPYSFFFFFGNVYFMFYFIYECLVTGTNKRIKFFFMKYKGVLSLSVYACMRVCERE